MTRPILMMDDLDDLDAPPSGDDEGTRTYTTNGCVTCYRSGSELDTPLKRCAKCGTNYCSVECQKKDWRTHKQLCKLVKQLESHESLFDELELIQTMSGRQHEIMGFLLKQRLSMFSMKPPQTLQHFIDLAIKDIPKDLVEEYGGVFGNEFLPASTLKKPLSRSDVGRHQIQAPGQPAMKYWSYERVGCMYKFQLLLDTKIKNIGVTMGLDYTMTAR